MKRFRADDFWFKLDSREDPTGRIVRYYVVTCHGCGQEAAFHCHGMSAEALRKYFQRRNWEIGKAQNQHYCPDCNKKHQSKTADDPPPEVSVPETSPPPVDPVTRLLEIVTLEEGRQVRELILEDFFAHADAAEIWAWIPTYRHKAMWAESPAVELDQVWEKCTAQDRVAFLNRVVGSIELSAPTEAMPDLIAFLNGIGGKVVLGERASTVPEPEPSPVPDVEPSPSPSPVPDITPSPSPIEPEDDDGPADWWKEMKASLK